MYRSVLRHFQSYAPRSIAERNLIFQNVTLHQQIFRSFSTGKDDDSERRTYNLPLLDPLSIISNLANHLNIISLTSRLFESFTASHRMKVRGGRHNFGNPTDTSLRVRGDVIPSPEPEPQQEEKTRGFGSFLMQQLAWGFGIALSFALINYLFFGGRKTQVIHVHDSQPQPQNPNDKLIQDAARDYAERDGASHTTGTLSQDDLIRQAQQYYSSQGTSLDVDYTGVNPTSLSNAKTMDGKKYW